MIVDKKLLAMKAVYTYFFPEVRRLVHATDNLEDNLFLTSTPVEEGQRIIDALNFRKQLVVPQTSDGKVDLDMLHEPVIDRIVEIYERVLPGLSDFKYRYFTPGSSQGIFHTLAELKTKGVNKISVFSGEYEGYKEYGKTLGLETVEIDPSCDISQLEKSVWFISNPSAIDGNIIPNERIKQVCDLGNQVMLDLAYVGSTREYSFDVSHDNIRAVFLSFSKPYGVFRFRLGVTFTREPVESLYANKWFKDIPRVLTSLRLAEEIGPGGLYEKYRPVQERIVGDLNRDFRLGIEPSDALLLGNLAEKNSRNLSSEQLELIEPYKRGNGYRFCLTPYFELAEKGGGK